MNFKEDEDFNEIKLNIIIKIKFENHIYYIFVFLYK